MRAGDSFSAMSSVRSGRCMRASDGGDAGPIGSLPSSRRDNGFMLSIGSVVIKVADVRRAAAFWCAALGYEPLREFADDFVILVPTNGVGQRISLDRDDSVPPDFPHVHLDLYAGDAADQAAEVERLVSLGATQVVDWPYPEGGHDFIVLADTEDNRFCVIDTTA